MELRDKNQLPTMPDEFKFNFIVFEYLPSSVSALPRFRSEVIDSGLEDIVIDLLAGNPPERFLWMQPVIDDQIAENKANIPLRFMSVVNELKRAQQETERDFEYEKKAEALGRLLYDVPDEDFNYRGFHLRLKTKDGKLHSYGWERLTLNSDDLKWWVGKDFPIEEIEEAMPWYQDN